MRDDTAKKIQQVGVAMTGLGCFILFGLPFLFVMGIFLWAVWKS